MKTIKTDFKLTEPKFDGQQWTGKAEFQIDDYPVIPTPPVVQPPPVVVVPPVITFPPGTGISSGFADALNSAVPDKPVVISKGKYTGFPDVVLKPGVSLIGFEKDGVELVPAIKRGWVNGADNSDALIKIASSSRVDGNQKIANIKITGAGALGGILVNNRDNVTMENIEVGGCNFFGVWARFAKGLKVNGMRLYDNSFANTQYASGEFCYCELDQFDINDVYVSSTVGNRGYGFKAIWGVDGDKFRNMYAGKFTKLRTNMHHDSAWNAGKSNNIGFECHGMHIKGDWLLQDCAFENQVSLHSPTDAGQTGKIRITNSIIDGENDRYGIEGIVNSLEVDHCTIKNTSQFIFNGQDNIKVSNWNIHDNNYDQGTAPTQSWGAVYLFGSKGAENVIMKNNVTRRKAANVLLKFQGVQGGVSIDASNVDKTF
jgi:hypothetical protein